MAKRAKRKSPASESSVPALPVKMIISGGQTGVDRAALEVAIKFHIPHGGWCPRGRLAEDGRIARHFKLKETESSRYYIRTELNVQEADGTLILFGKQLHGGTALTKRYAQRHRKPVLAVDIVRDNVAEQVTRIRRWLIVRKIQILNIAGPRESSSPGIGAIARRLLIQLLQPAHQPARPKPSRSVRRRAVN